MSFLKRQLVLLKKAIDNGIIEKNDPLLLEQKEIIIDLLADMHRITGDKTSKTEIGARVDKLFADILGVD